MRHSNPIELPSEKDSFFDSLRFTFYTKYVLRMLAVPVAALYVLYFAGRESLAHGDLLEVAVLLVVLATGTAPQFLLLFRLFHGLPGQSGLLKARQASESWRMSWESINDQSNIIRQRCVRSSGLWKLPNYRHREFSNDFQHALYTSPSQVLADIPDGPAFVTYGDVENQPIHTFDAGSAESALELMTNIAGTVVGRIMSKDLGSVVFKYQSSDEIRIVFVTDIPAGKTSHGYIWLTVSLRRDGCLVNGFVESVRAFYFDKGRYSYGYSYKGDQAWAKQRLMPFFDLALVLSPYCILMSFGLWRDSILELLDGRISAAFFSCVPPDAGDSLELKLVGLVGGGLETDKGFVSRVEGVRTNLVADVDLVISAFRAANQRVA